MGYTTTTVQDFIRAQEGMIAMNYSLATEAKACCPEAQQKKAPEKKMGKPMRYRYNCDEEYDSDYRGDRADQKTDYLEGRQSTIYCRKMTELQKQFGLTDDAAPESATEIIERITAGKFIVPSKEAQDARAWHQTAYGMIRWRDPSLKEDKDGFSAAMKALDAEQIRISDAITILSPEAALSAIQAFENWTYSGNA